MLVGLAVRVTAWIESYDASVFGFRILPGTVDGQVRTVKIEGSWWSKATVPTGQNRARSYL